MDEAKSPDARPIGEVFTYARFACRRADGAITMGASIYGGIATHASAEFTIAPEKDDYDFWLWLVFREKERDTEYPFLNQAEVQEAREEYARQAALHGDPLLDRAAVESLPLAREWSPDEERRMRRILIETHPLNPLSWLWLLGTMATEGFRWCKQRWQAKGSRRR